MKDYHPYTCTWGAIGERTFSSRAGVLQFLRERGTGRIRVAYQKSPDHQRQHLANTAGPKGGIILEKP